MTPTKPKCVLAPRHDPDLQGYCRACREPVSEPWFMRRRPEPAEIVSELARRSGVYISPGVAQNIADALLDYADSSYEVRQQVDRRAWQDERHREHILADLRRKLFEGITSEGHIPTALPSQAIRYLTMPSFVGNEQQVEVPARAAEAGADYEAIEITLRVQCRTPAIDRAAAVRAGLL